MARAAKVSDPIYNTRRRFRRAAERFSKKATKAKSLSERKRWEFVARDAIEKAISTYDTGSKVSGKIQQMAAQLDVDVDKIDRVQSKIDGEKDFEARKTAELNRLEAQSEKATFAKTRTREQQARYILNTGNIGHRIFGGLRNLWYDENDPAGNADPLSKLKEKLGVKDTLDLLEKIEAVAPDVYTKGELSESEIYDLISSQLRMLERTNQI